MHRTLSHRTHSHRARAHGAPLAAALLSTTLLAAACGVAGPDPDRAAATAQAITGPNLLANAGFDLVGPSGSSVTVSTSTANTAYPSAAASWRMYTTTAGYIHTDLLASTRPSRVPGGNGQMIHVLARGANNGILQAWDAYDRGPEWALATAYVYIKSGSVCIGAGNGSSTGCGAAYSILNQWIQISTPVGAWPANEIILYSTGEGGEFYVDFASVQSQNLVKDGSFEIGQPDFTPVAWSGVYAGPSAASYWETFLNHSGTISTDLEPSTLTSGKMLHVKVDVVNSGVAQLLQEWQCAYGPTHGRSGAWVYLVSGYAVGIGSGNCGNTGIDAYTTVKNQWIYLESPSGASPTREFIVYSFDPTLPDQNSHEQFEFYVDESNVLATP